MGSGMIRFDPVSSAGNWASNPFGTTDYGIYINSSGQLVYSSAGSTTILGAAGSGSGSVPTWEQVFAGDQTMQLAGTTWTIDNNTGTNDVLTITNSGASTGSLIQITNAGTGSDIKGTSATWSVSKAGVAVFTQVTCPILYSAASQLISCAGAGTITIGANSNTITMADATTFSATVTVTDGISLLQSTSNAANALTVVNNTATTYGDASASTGVVRISSTSLTTGTLLKLQLTQGTLTTGWYLNCYDVTGTASVFKIAKYGATTIGGSAYATAALTITAGDIVVTAGKITQTAVGATSANGYTGTFNGLTTGVGMSLVHTTSVITTGGSLMRISSTGVDDSASTGCLLDLVSSGSTAGTQVLATFSALTTGIGFSMVLAGLTTGQGIKVAQTTAIIADGGSVMALSSSGINTGGATNGTVLDLKTTAQLAGTMVRVDSIQTTGTVMSIISTGIMTTTGNLLTLTGNAATSAAGLLRVNANGLVAGIGAVIASSSTALTIGRLLSVSHSGNATATANCAVAEVSSAAADDTTILKVTGSAALAAGTGLEISLAAMTTGIGLSMDDMAALTTGTGIAVASTGTTRTDGMLLSLTCASTAATSTGRMLLVNHTGATGVSTILAEIKTAATDETIAFQVLASAALAAGKVVNLSAAAMTTGTALAINDLNALTTGTGVSVMSNSADVTARNVVYIKNDHASAVGASPFTIENDAVQGTGSKFKRGLKLCNITLWVSIDGTTPNGALTGDNVGDMCFNASTGKPLICTGTNVWAAVA